MHIKTKGIQRETFIFFYLCCLYIIQFQWEEKSWLTSTSSEHVIQQLGRLDKPGSLTLHHISIFSHGNDHFFDRVNKFDFFFLLGSIRRWKLLSFFVAVPAVGLTWLNAHLKEQEHEEHYEKPEFHKYEHMYLRSKVSFTVCNVSPTFFESAYHRYQIFDVAVGK